MSMNLLPRIHKIKFKTKIPNVLSNFEVERKKAKSAVVIMELSFLASS